MPRLSAALLPYRLRNDQLEVLLVHPGGPFWAKKDLAAWSIPKGEYEGLEDPKTAAKREFKEETGYEPPAGKWVELGEVKYSNKVVTAWAVEGDLDASKVNSNLFSMEWPPHSGKTQEFPEVDKAEWFDIETAKQKINQGQIALLRKLEELLG